jgi:hypothetical protein
MLLPDQRPSGEGCTLRESPNEKDQAHAEALLCRKIASKKQFIFSLTTVCLVPVQFIFMHNHIPVCQMCTAACEQLLIYLYHMPNGCFFKLGWVGIWAVWKFHFETRNQATPGYTGFDYSLMMNQGWVSVFQDPPETPLSRPLEFSYILGLERLDYLETWSCQSVRPL